MLNDSKFALRMLRKAPGFALIAVMTLGLGIGANTAMFSVLNSVLLRPLPLTDANRVVALWQRQSNGQTNVLSTPFLEEWRRQSGFVAQSGLFVGTTYNLASHDAPERITGARISREVFTVAAVDPELGHTLSAEDDRPGSGNVVVLSHALWKSRFGGDRAVLGTSITLDGAPATVIGVMPAGFQIFGSNELLWTPLKFNPLDPAMASPSLHWLLLVGRLPAGTSMGQAQAQLDAAAARLRQQDSRGDAGAGIQLQPLREVLSGSVKSTLLLLTAAVGFVLLIACANVANLLLARGNARHKEISIRAALGARRSRLIRQFMTESVLLAAAGGCFAVLLAWGAVRAIPVFASAALPEPQSISLDGRALAFTAGLCLLMGILFGIAPALQGSRADIEAALKQGVRGSSEGGGRQRVLLIVAETALASMLLIASGLVLKSLWRSTKVELGFNPRNVITLRIAAPQQMRSQQFPEFYGQVIERIRAIPGVEQAALGRNLPLGGGDPSMPITVEGREPQLPQGAFVTRLRAIGPGYFQALSIPLMRGRDFSDADGRGSAPVAIVSRSLAERYWPGEDPVGKRLQPKFPGAPQYTVVGEVGDVRHWGPDVDVEPTAYYAYTQFPATLLPLLEKDLAVVVQTAPGRSASSAALLGQARAAVGALNKTIVLADVKTMDELVVDSGSLRRFDLILLGAFAGLALVLAAIGVYGVMAYLVAQRTREIGIRMALGADRGDILRLVLGKGGRMATVGIALGLAGAAALTRFMASLLFNVSPTDALTMSVAPVLVLGTLLIACYVPARRASQIEPLKALRCD